MKDIKFKRIGKYKRGDLVKFTEYFKDREYFRPAIEEDSLCVIMEIAQNSLSEVYYKVLVQKSLKVIAFYETELELVSEI